MHRRRGSGGRSFFLGGGGWSLNSYPRLRESRGSDESEEEEEVRVFELQVDDDLHFSESFGVAATEIQTELIISQEGGFPLRKKGIFLF